MIGLSPQLRANPADGVLPMLTTTPPGFTHSKHLTSVSPPALSNTTSQSLATSSKRALTVINGDVRAQTLHQFHIALPDGRENRRAQVTG